MQGALGQSEDVEAGDLCSWPQAAWRGDEAEFARNRPRDGVFLQHLAPSSLSSTVRRAMIHTT